MARYYESETLIEFVKKYTPTINGETTMECVERAIHYAPTADVVPNSEVEELQAKVARLRKENTELLISKETDLHISMEKLIKVRTEHPIFKAIEEKTARDIFAKLETFIDHTAFADCWSEGGFRSSIAELRNKYIGQSCNGCERQGVCEKAANIENYQIDGCMDHKEKSE